MKKSLGNRLKKAREKKDLTQIEVSKLTGISNKTISNYENDVSQPDPSTLALFAQVYETSVDYLIGRVDNPKHKVVEKHELPQELANLVDYIEILKDSDISDITPEELKYAIEFAKKIKGNK